MFPGLQELVREESIVLPGTDVQWAESGRGMSRRMSEMLETLPMSQEKGSKADMER